MPEQPWGRRHHGPTARARIAKVGYDPTVTPEVVAAGAADATPEATADEAGAADATPVATADEAGDKDDDHPHFDDREIP